MRVFVTLLRGLGLSALLLGLLAPLPGAAQTESDDLNTLTIGANICDIEEPTGPSTGPLPCEPFVDATVTVTDESGAVAGQCILELVGAGSISLCTVEVPFETSYRVTLDEASVPDGYRLAENDIAITVGTIPTGGGDGPAINFRIYLDEPADATEPATEPTDTPATETVAEPGAAGTGSPAAIYAGACDPDFAEAEAVAVLSETTTPEGDSVGADGASAVETSFTTLDLPLDDILAEDHVLVVFDEDDDSVALACGAIGGVVSDGSLAFGLSTVDDSGFSGVAYLTGDGDRTLATVFLAEDRSDDETPAA